MRTPLLVSGLCATAAFAQVPAPPSDGTAPRQMIRVAPEGPIGPIGITTALAGPMLPIAGAPYSAQAVTQRVQTLADGNRITQTTTNSVARDSKGRVYREESLPGLGPGSPEPPHLVLIEDPVAGVHITLDSNTKTAMKMQTGQMKKLDEASAANGVPAIASDRLFFHTATPGPPAPNIQILTTHSAKLTDEGQVAKTDVGTQTIEGVPAKGTKLTRTIPAGEMGNELPLVITTETWYSPDLKLLVMSKSNDPRMGETTYKLTNISRTEPDPALFQIPSDYTVKDQPENVVVRRVEK